MSKGHLTKKQKLMYDFVADFIADNGYSPTFREIAAGLNYSSIATVANHINNLIKLGWLTKIDRSGRSLELATDQQIDFSTVDLIKTKIVQNWPNLSEQQQDNVKTAFADLGIENLLTDIDI